MPPTSKYTLHSESPLKIEIAADSADQMLACHLCWATDQEDEALTHVVGVSMDRSGYKGRYNVEIDIECENGHRFVVIFNQHKGRTYLGTDGFEMIGQ